MAVLTNQLKPIMRKLFIAFLSYLLTVCLQPVCAQVAIGDNPVIDYNSPKEYEIAAITVSGIQFSDQNALKIISGLSVG